MVDTIKSVTLKFSAEPAKDLAPPAATSHQAAPPPVAAAESTVYTCPIAAQTCGR